MSFMQQEIRFDRWYEIETTNGTEFIPDDLVGLEIKLNETSDDDEDLENVAEYCEGDPQTIKRIEGWGCRLSAPGYMDCTQWSVFDSEKDAKDHLEEMYGDDEPDEPEEGDYVTEDHIKWIEQGTGKLLLTTADPDDPACPAENVNELVKAHMAANNFSPNAWFISDHGNAHLIDLK